MTSNDRPDWDPYFLGVATAVAARADCTRRKVGAVIADIPERDRRILGTGYNGTEPGGKSCLKGQCPRGRNYRMPCDHGYCNCTKTTCACGDSWPCVAAAVPGSSYDTGSGSCISVHAEANALLFARASVMGATLYCTDKPCDGCSRLIRVAGIARVVWPDGEESYPDRKTVIHSEINVLLGDDQVIGEFRDGRLRVETPPKYDPIDPEFVKRNRKRSPVDDMPICERRGCGHLIGMHYYSLTADQKDEHRECSLECGCEGVILTPKPKKET